MAGIGFFATGCLLGIATKAYIWRYGNQKAINTPLNRLIGIFVMAAGGIRLGEVVNYLEQKKIERYGLKLSEYHPTLYQEFQEESKK